MNDVLEQEQKVRKWRLKRTKASWCSQATTWKYVTTCLNKYMAKYLLEFYYVFWVKNDKKQIILEEIHRARHVTLKGFLIRSPQLFTDVGLQFHTMRFDWAMWRNPNVTTQKQDKYEWEVARKQHKARHYRTGP